jgi:hypothetical protein
VRFCLRRNSSKVLFLQAARCFSSSSSFFSPSCSSKLNFLDAIFTQGSDCPVNKAARLGVDFENEPESSAGIHESFCDGRGIFRHCTEVDTYLRLVPGVRAGRSQELHEDALLHNGNMPRCKYVRPETAQQTHLT